MTLLQLEYFKTMSKLLHYSRAAEALHTSQPNLSYAISELEKELGVPLFQKQGRRIVLSQYGLHFSFYVEEALNSLLKGRETLFQMSNPTDIISLAFIDEVGYDFLPDLLRDFTAEHPSISFHLYQHHNNVIVPKLLDESCDMAFSIENPANPALCSLPIIEQNMMLFVPPNHRLAGHTSVSLSEIGIDPMVVLSPNTGIRRIVDDMCREAQVQFNVVFEAEECNAAATYVSAGLAVCILPRTPLHTKYRAVAVPILSPSRCRRICLLYNTAHPMSHAALKFRDFVLARFPAFQSGSQTGGL